MVLTGISLLTHNLMVRFLVFVPVVLILSVIPIISVISVMLRIWINDCSECKQWKGHQENIKSEPVMSFYGLKERKGKMCGVQESKG